MNLFIDLFNRESLYPRIVLSKATAKDDTAKVFKATRRPRNFVPGALSTGRNMCVPFIRWGFCPPGLLSVGAFIRWGVGLFSAGLLSEGLLSEGLLSTPHKSYQKNFDFTKQSSAHN